jgi:hypothetical protein
MNTTDQQTALPAGLWVAELTQLQAQARAATLFRRSFAAELPDYPIHFALLSPDRTTALAYVHFSLQNDYALGGGMCIDAMAFRGLEAQARQQIRERGGLAQILLEHAVSMLDGPSAAFGYVGDRLALAIDLRAGFAPAGPERLIVRWLKPLPATSAKAMIDEVAALGPF